MFNIYATVYIEISFGLHLGHFQIDGNPGLDLHLSDWKLFSQQDISKLLIGHLSFLVGSFLSQSHCGQKFIKLKG